MITLFKIFGVGFVSVAISFDAPWWVRQVGPHFVIDHPRKRFSFQTKALFVDLRKITIWGAIIGTGCWWFF